MLSPGEIAKIRADIERLEKARVQCDDTGIPHADRGLDRGAKAEVESGKNSKWRAITSDLQLDSHSFSECPVIVQEQCYERVSIALWIHCALRELGLPITLGTERLLRGLYYFSILPNCNDGSRSGLPNCFPNVLPSLGQRSGVLGVALLHGANATKSKCPEFGWLFSQAAYLLRPTCGNGGWTGSKPIPV